jgi:hypothetical protein
MTTRDGPVAADAELACYCCGDSFASVDVVRFGRHPADGVCARCANWVYERSQSMGGDRRRPYWWWLLHGMPRRHTC